MTSRRGRAASSLDQIYNQHGDTRPSRFFLEKAYKAFTASDRPDKLLAAAHVSIDLAFADPDRAEYHLAKSNERLTDIIETADAYAQYTLRTTNDRWRSLPCYMRWISQTG